MNVPDDSKAINFLCLPPVIPQTFKNFRHVISSKLTRYRSQAIRAPVNTLIQNTLYTLFASKGLIL